MSRLLRHASFLALAIAFIVTSTAIAAEQSATADLILHHGKILTVDKAFSIAQAIAVKDGKILRVGSDADVLASKGDKTQIIDLAGKTVLPGLIDSHVHPRAA